MHFVPLSRQNLYLHHVDTSKLQQQLLPCPGAVTIRVLTPKFDQICSASQISQLVSRTTSSFKPFLPENCCTEKVFKSCDFLKRTKRNCPKDFELATCYDTHGASWRIMAPIRRILHWSSVVRLCSVPRFFLYHD